MESTLPQQFVERLPYIVGEENVSAVLQTFAQPRMVSIRVNTINATVAAGTTVLAKAGIKFRPVPWYAEAFVLPDSVARIVTDLPEYEQGWFYIQNLSSMIPALILDPQPGDHVLDIAAAPGSKTGQIAALMGNDGEIVANDVSRDRMFRLIANMKTQGVSIVKPSTRPGQALWPKYPEYFDNVLVDTPCSMEGMFNSDDPHSYTQWSRKKVKNLSKQQKWLLRSAISMAKPGATIVYSTCTLSPEENEGVIDWILQKEQGNVETEPVLLSGLNLVPALTAWEGKPYHSGVVNARRVMPDGTMEGFFVAKIRKLHSTVSAAATM